MSRRDYIELAADFKRLRENHDYAPRPHDIYVRGIDQAIDAVCDALKRDNRNFDRQRFLTACGR